MNEAPKILWYDDQECSAGPVQFNSDEVKYIRADLVDGLVDLLVEWQNVTSANKDWGDYEMRIEYALATLKEEE